MTSKPLCHADVCSQAELKHKLSERSKLVAEYEVPSPYCLQFGTFCGIHRDSGHSCPLLPPQQQQLGRKDRVLQQQQQKLEEAQQKAQEVGLGRVAIMTQVKVEDVAVT